MALYICYCSEAFLGKFLQNFSGDQVIAWGLFRMDFIFYDIYNLVDSDFLHW